MSIIELTSVTPTTAALFAECPRCNYRQAIEYGCVLATCLNCNTKYTVRPAPLPTTPKQVRGSSTCAIMIANAIRQEFRHRHIKPDGDLYELDHDYPLRGTTNGAALYVKDCYNNQYIIKVELR